MAYAILNEGQDVFFTSDSYKPHVDYVEGSYSLLVQHFVREHGGNIVDKIEDSSVVVKVHESDYVDPQYEGVVFDPWRTHQGINTLHYGNTRNTET